MPGYYRGKKSRYITPFKFNIWDNFQQAVVNFQGGSLLGRTYGSSEVVYDQGNNATNTIPVKIIYQQLMQEVNKEQVVTMMGLAGNLNFSPYRLPNTQGQLVPLNNQIGVAFAVVHVRKGQSDALTNLALFQRGAQIVYTPGKDVLAYNQSIVNYNLAPNEQESAFQADVYPFSFDIRTKRVLEEGDTLYVVYAAYNIPIGTQQSMPIQVQVAGSVRYFIETGRR